MRTIRLASEDDFDGWRNAARGLAMERVPADQVIWQVGDEASDLFCSEPEAPPAVSTLRVSREFVTLASQAALHAEPERFSLLYTLLTRIVENPLVLRDRADRQFRRAEEWAQNVRRDIHKMHAFVRFREIEEEDGGKRFIAWYEPEHHILRHNAEFFLGRFANMRWSILTPRGTLHWDCASLQEGPPATRADAPAGDPVEETWKAYYSAIFNPARLMTRAMLKEMPRKYWKNMPETALVPSLIAGARKRELGMIEQAQAAPARNGAAALDLLREEAACCRRCPLWQPATQTVFGEGPREAEVMIVGEQPGDQEDQAGRPFVGPAGQIFDRAMAEAGVAREGLYITNAVKHFKYEARGKQRIHARPNAGEIEACRWWVDQERAIVRPKLVLAMGATAARSLLGRAVTISKERGRPIPLADGALCWVTVHPSYILRLPDEERAAAEYRHFVEDIGQAMASLRALPVQPAPATV
ncbi:UdgX family uracil-DNA binding protein [Acetobacteraceae bacterium H6797]|nr:UdgX family uracil-DNA binding protein [Acetobacteraceae bacterium H6797]